MKLLAIRDINAQDPLPTLGPKVTPPAPPDPAPLRPTSTPGIMQRPDGKLETDLPLPPPDPAAASLEDRWVEACKKARADFNARGKRVMMSPFFSGTDKNSWWVAEADGLNGVWHRDFADVERHEPVTLASVADDFKRAWQTDLANIEKRWFASAGSLADMPPLFEKKKPSP